MKQLLTAILLVLCFGAVHADEFVVRSFKADPADLSAIQFAQLDVNDEKCAIIKVRTDLRNLAFDSGKNLAKNVEFKNGEYWLYVSPGERRLTVIKEDFITLHYSIEIPIRSSKVYVLEITNKEKGSAATGSMILNTQPQGAVVEIRELSGMDFITPVRLIDYPSFPYSITIGKNRYQTLDTILTIHPGEEIVHNLKLAPVWGDLIINVDPPDAEIYVDDEYFGTGNQELMSEESGINVGVHTITVLKEKYNSVTKTIEISHGNNGTLDFILKPKMGFLGIDVNPGDATILINGIQSTRVPFEDSLLVGTYNVVISREGYLEVSKTIEVQKNQRIEIYENLAHTRSVRITSEPSGAGIYLRGNYLGTTPENVVLTYGSNTLTLKKQNYETLEQRVEIEASTDKISLEMEPAKYKVTINSYPESANVYINNRLLETTPVELRLPYGSYRLMVEKYGYFRKRKTIKVGFDNQRFNLQLRSLRHVRLGFVRGADSWGGEISYVEDLFGLTLGYFQPPKVEFSGTVKHRNIEPDDYYNLSTSGSVGKHTNNDSINFKIIGKGHLFLNRAPTVSFVLGFAMGRIHYSEVYQADANYENSYSGELIREGDYYSIARKGAFKVSPIAGVSLRILRYFYVGAEYWFLTEKGTAFFVNGGICYPLN